MHGRQGADAVDADSEAHHVELILRKALDAGGIQYMPHRLVAQGLPECGGVRPEHLYLPQGKLVLFGVFRHRQVREGRFHADGAAALEVFEERRQFACHEAQPVHAGVHFYMDGEVLHSAFFQHGHEGLQGLQVGDGRLQIVLDHLFEEVSPGGEHQNGQGDTRAAQLHTLYREGDGQIVGARLLHEGGEFHGPVPVGIGLDQHQHLRFLLQQGTEIPVVARSGREAQFEP